MKNKHFFLLLLIVALLIASIIKGFSQDSTSYTYTIKVPVKVVHDTVTITKPVPVYIHDTVYVPRLIYKCPSDTPVIITPSKDTLKFSAFNSSFKKWVDELIRTKKIGVLDRNVPVNEAVNFIGDFTIIGVNKPTLTISSNQLFWLKEGNHIFNNVNILGSIIGGNVTLINSSLSQLRMLTSGKLMVDKSVIKYVGGGGINNLFELTVSNSVIESIMLTNIKSGSHIFMRGNSTFKPSFNWKPPTGLIITEQ